MINWINSWRSGSKKQKFEISIRLGKLTVIEAKACLLCEDNCKAKRFRFIIFNFGFEI